MTIASYLKWVDVWTGEKKERKGSSSANMSKAIVVNSGELFVIMQEQIGL